MRRILVSWIGRTDLRAPKEEAAVGLGPIAQALAARTFDDVLLVTDYPESEVRPFAEWLTGRSGRRPEILRERLSGPTQFGEIYEAAARACTVAVKGHKSASLSFHLSPGTPAMAAVWIILAKTRFPAELIESSREHGVRTASVPFDISAEFLPDLLATRDDAIRRQAAAESPESPDFAALVHRSAVMKRLLARARLVAARDVPVLIEGESGTGKELLARAIHRSSPRRSEPFLAVNCGAIPAELVESELFGHEKGAFTGASAPRAGHFEAAAGGTIFLDEIGELPRLTQVKLLRVLQEGEVVRVGASKPLRIQARVIAATNRTLLDEVGLGRFREDLFFRLAVAVLKLPALRERPGDLGLLIDHVLGQVNRDSAAEPGYQEKRLSPGAKNLLLAHAWPGNVRELVNTLRRVTIWSTGAVIQKEEVAEALFPLRAPAPAGILDRALGEGFSLPDTLATVARHYLRRALGDAAGNKTRAAGLVGLPSYQTLTNWLSKYGVRADGTARAE